VSKPESRRVLIVDDDIAIRTSLADAVSEWASEVRVAADGSEALARIAESVPDLVISDVRMPGTGGVELLQLLRERAPATDVVLMTAYEDMSTIVTAMREGAIDFIVKPISLETLRRLVERVFNDRATRRIGATPKQVPAEYALDALVGRDARMIEVFKMVGQAAAGRANVLVRGESGTGKELIARAVHFNSRDATEPFIAVNCAALPATLLESELFGHTRGAFTAPSALARDASRSRGAGPCSSMRSATPRSSSRASCFGCSRSARSIHSAPSVPERTEARVIAATHRNLEALVAEGRFREDLYYRLRIVEIALPPLRDRLGDIPELARRLVRRARRQRDIPSRSSATQRSRRLLAHEWRGNVRELENCLTRATVLAAGGVIHPEHLGLAKDSVFTTEPLGSLDDVERDHVVRVLTYAAGQKTRAAEILGVSRPRLDRLLRKYRLE
jgi:DNA-binding NtrC family response regulator